mmetsp:Transcript_71581/g.203084  ORF Transcript_71581/g.203084 Transcript_71581/m.203084 type:complete len:431 (-) Transcript_71581:99-1391(-)
MPRLPNHAFRYCLLVRFTACTRALHTVPIPVVQRNQAHGGQALIPGVQASDTGQVNEALGSQDEEETSDKSSLFQAPSNKSKANASLLQRANRSRTRRPPAAAAAAGAGVLAPELAAEDFGAGRAAEAKVNTILEAGAPVSLVAEGATAGGKAHEASNSASVQLVLWACLAAIISTVFVFVIVMVWMHCGAASSRYGGNSEALKSLMAHRDRGTSRSSHTERSQGRSSLPSDRSGQSEDDSGAMSSLSTTRTSAAGLPGLPLCPLLVVPDGTRLGCVVQNDVCRMKQELSFDVSAVPTRGGAPLFRARVSELGSDGPAIYVETLGGRDQLAFLTTEDLWRGSSNPVLGISRPWGLPYGTMQKGENGEYVVVRGQSPLLTFSGDYLAHSIQVMVPSGHTIATTLQTSPEEYQVHMQARADAGPLLAGHRQV